MRVFLKGGHVSSSLEKIQMYVCGSEKITLTTAGAKAIEKYEKEAADITSTDINGYFTIDSSDGRTDCAEKTLELYSDEVLSTVWSDSKIVLDKSTPKITVDSSTFFAKKTVYLKATTKGDKSVSKQIDIEVKHPCMK